MNNNTDALLATLKQKYDLINPYLNEKTRRIWAATEVKVIGRGGLKLIQKVTKLSHNTIQRGIHDLNSTVAPNDTEINIRKHGGGRKKSAIIDVTLLDDVKNLVEYSTRGDPESPLLWCSKSTRHIANELNKDKKRTSHVGVANILKDLDYTLQSNRKVHEGANNPDRDAQFQFINAKTKAFLAARNPVISVDTKKKENIGNFKNAGQEYHLKGNAPKVNVYDFVDKENGKAAPYGIYDISKNIGWVNVGISSDTAEFAVNSIRSWWNNMGQEMYSTSSALYINADGGGSNGSRVRLWKIELQKLATEINKVIHVSHFPPGTRKWNKIEHKMFSFISKNWRGKPLIDSATVVQLISNTTTQTGLKIKAVIDNRIYKKGIQVTDEELQKVRIEKEIFHGEWNYKILP